MILERIIQSIELLICIVCCLMVRTFLFLMFLSLISSFVFLFLMFTSSILSFIKHVESKNIFKNLKHKRVFKFNLKFYFSFKTCFLLKCVMF